jgi:hypothetical protein
MPKRGCNGGLVRAHSRHCHRLGPLQALRLVLEAAAKGYGATNGHGYTQQATLVLNKAGRVAEVKGIGQEVQFPSPDLAAIVTGRACGIGAAELRAAAERVVAPQSTAAAAAQVLEIQRKM